MKARLYGSESRQGKLKDFEVVDSLPEKGDAVNFGDPGYVWGDAQEARLDPEQRHRDENEIGNYDFWVVPEIDVEDGETVELHYFATIKKLTDRESAEARSVKEICQLAGMTQTAVAERFSIPWRTFSNWCTGTRECPIYTKLMMQEILGLYKR